MIIQHRRSRRLFDAGVALCIGTLMLFATVHQLEGFAFVFAGDSNGIDVVTHPTGYTGAGGTLTVSVGIDPTSVNASDMITSVQNVICVFNELEPTTANLATADVPGSSVDFESTLLHEMGHSLGLAHPNAATESGLSGDDRNYTKTTTGDNNSFDLDDGTDNVIGSSDDTRGDDVNLHWYLIGVNSPFTISDSVVDSTTYTRELGSLPAGHTFATNGDRDVSTLLGVTRQPDSRDIIQAYLRRISPFTNEFGAFEAYQNPDGTLFWATEESLVSRDGRWAQSFAGQTEAAMQQGAFFAEAQRTLTHDDVAAIRFAESGLDEIAGTADDYDLVLVYEGLTSSADITIDFDSTLR